MKKVYVFSALLLLVGFGTFAQCGPNQIELRKSGQRDWVGDFNNLVTTVGNNETINSLRPFFFEATKAKNCISIADIHKLDEQLEKIAGAYPTEKAVINLRNAVRAVTGANPLTTSTTQAPVNDLTSSSPVASDQTLDSTMNDTAVSDVNASEAEQLPWKWIAIGFGVLALLLGGAFISETGRLKKQIAGLKMEEINRQGNKRFISEKNDTDRENLLKADAKNWKDKYLKLDHAHRTTVAEMDKYKKGKSQPALVKTVLKPEQLVKETVVEKAPELPFYLSNPTAMEDGSGIFKDMRQGQINPANSFYKFIADAEGKTARFWFIENQNIVQSALVYPESFIDPACEYQNFNSGATNIKTNEPGTAEKQGDNWKIVQKAKITFV